MIYYAYLDDSYDKNQSQFFVCAVVTGQLQQWKLLRTKWNQRLKAEGLSYFKSSEYYGLRGEFRKYQSESDYPKPSGREAAQKIRDDLELIVENCGIKGMAITMRMSDFDEVATMPESAGFMPSNPYQWVLQSVFLETTKELRQISGKHRIIFGHDESSNFRFLRECYEAFRDKNRSLGKYMGGFEALDDKKHPPVQVADMLANLTVNHALQQAKNPELAVTRLTRSIVKLNVWKKEFMVHLVQHNRLKASGEDTDSD